MDEQDRRDHWNTAYATKGEAGVSWYQDHPTVSLDLIARTGAGPSSALIDVGGGASRLVDALLDAGWTKLSVLDISDAALSVARERLGKTAAGIEWIAADVRTWSPREAAYDVWHDRAVFHFLTAPEDRAAYVERLNRALSPDGHVVIGTFAADGPERCSGLPVMRYDAGALAAALGGRFERVEDLRHQHTTPWGSTQSFQFVVLRRRRN
jgi:ubiquinone/menaquinone biosynthesis C-methylase UbiE